MHRAISGAMDRAHPFPAVFWAAQNLNLDDVPTEQASPDVSLMA